MVIHVRIDDGTVAVSAEITPAGDIRKLAALTTKWNGKGQIARILKCHEACTLLNALLAQGIPWSVLASSIAASSRSALSSIVDAADEAREQVQPFAQCASC